MTRVAIYLPTLCMGKGGAEKVACNVANILVRAGNEVTILHRESPDPPSYELDPRIRLVAATLREPERLDDYKGCFDVLIGFAMLNVYVSVAVLADVLGAPFIIQECTNPPRMVSLMAMSRQEGIRDIREAYWVRQAVLAHAAGIRMTLPGYRSTIIEDIRSHCDAFPNSFAIDPERVEPILTRRRKVVCVGGLKTFNKNGIDVLRAFIESGIGERGWCLEFVGANNMEDAYERLRREAPQGSVIDRGVVNDLDAIYGDAQILAIPSFEEGLPNVVVEAFCFAVPCIGYGDCAGTNELIATGETGILVDREAPGGMANALRKLAEDDDLREELNAKTAAFAKKTFDPRLFSERWCRLVENAATGRDVHGRRSVPFAQRNLPQSRAFRKMLRADLIENDRDDRFPDSHGGK